MQHSMTLHVYNMYAIFYLCGELGLMYCLCDLSDTTVSCHVIVHGTNTWMVNVGGTSKRAVT